MIIEVRKQYKSFSKEDILERITEYDIYRYYAGVPFKVNVPFSSPLRSGDKEPSFLISNRHGFYHHVDFADSRYRGDAFAFVQQKYNADFSTAKRIINQDFNLGLDTGELSQEYKKITSEYHQPKMVEKHYRNIQVTPKKFSSSELRWWASYYQGLSDLKAEEVYSVKDAYVDKTRVGLGKDEMVFGYLYQEKHWKIYRPLATQKGKKWMSSVPIDMVDGIDDIKDWKQVVVTKSKKDKMVLRKVLPNVIAVQNETLVALSDELIKKLKQVPDVYINYDCDKPGIKNSLIVTKEFGFKHINVPGKYLEGEPPVKDFADMARYHHLHSVADYFKQKNLI